MLTTTTTARPSDRLLSVVCYLGLSPLVRLCRSSKTPFFQHHQTQAMAALFIALAVFGTIVLFDTAETIVFICFPAFGEYLANRLGSYANWLEFALWVPILAVAVLWISLIGLAIAGSTWPVPLLTRLTRRPRIVRLCSIANTLVFVFIPLIAVFAIYATSLTQRSCAGASVYFLYDEGIPVPRWGYAMGLCRVALQAQRNWGKERTVLDRLNKETLRTALADGKIVIIATHGGNGRACTYYAPEKLGIAPPDSGTVDAKLSSRFLRTSVLGPDNKWGQWEDVEVNSGVRLVYLFACEAGKRESQWEEHLAPAKVIAYDRASTVWDHAYWFAWSGPAQMKRLAW